MSSTETQLDPVTVRDTLRVFAVHETGSELAPVTTPDQNRGDVEEPATPPPDPNWPSDWRRMPAYRETSRTHRISDRPAGTNAAESGLVVAMFAGVWMIGVRESLHTPVLFHHFP